MNTESENIAQTLARELPKAQVLDVPTSKKFDIEHVAVPAGYKLETIDNEKHQAHPNRIASTATLNDTDSFTQYVARHCDAATIVWCDFNPQTLKLSFEAVFDEHAPALAGWRSHRATFAPDMSVEWKAWAGSNKRVMPQVEFAEWLEAHEDDINSTSDSLPTSLQMKAMATEFVANEDRVLKSTARLQSGGVQLVYIADPDKGTTEAMKLFERFAIGIPVFHGGSAWGITSRLKYRLSAGAVKFFYELIRHDKVHDAAAKELIEKIRSSIGGVPLLMGACK